jgi:hypothetical protein
MNWTVSRTERTLKLESTYEAGFQQPYRVAVINGWTVREEMIEWCSVRFGRHTRQWKNPRWTSDIGHNTFCFKNARDRTMFLLRWS